VGRASSALLDRLADLEAHLGVGPAYVPVNQGGVDLLHSFTVLAHAEIEEFLEYLARTAIEVTRNRSQGGILTHAGHHLLVSRSIRRATDGGKDPASARYPWFATVEATLQNAASPQDLASALEQHESRIKGNHGIKSANVRRLLLPLGYRDYFFEIGLLDRLTAIGNARGAVAHGTGLGVANWPTGATAVTPVHTVGTGLALLERFLPRVLMPA
jgi:hypothetical protein